MAGFTTEQNPRFFVAKCNSIDALRRCVATGNWASRTRLSAPQPHEVLAKALSQGPVIFIFSVNNCHGWHGYCSMVSSPVTPAQNLVSPATPSETVPKHEGSLCKPDSIVEPDAKSGEESGESTVSENTTCIKSEKESHTRNAYSSDLEHSEQGVACASWHFFTVKWQTEFISSFGEACLSSSKTSHLCLMDGAPLNKARNWQEMSVGVGREMCCLLDSLREELEKKRVACEEQKQASRPAPFLRMEESAQAVAGEYWASIVRKVQLELGHVHLACPFGSQRYNLQQAESDIDAFIVYQANTRDLLGFDPPKMTIKNSDHETCDYTVLELKRYCELLLSYDARCIETLFLDESTVLQGSDYWRKLQGIRQQFLTRKCLDKYLSDALGSNGLQKFERLLEKGSVTDDQMLPPRIAKLVYIIIRLLQNALDIVKGRPLCVFRSTGSEEHNLLMKIRHRSVTVGQAKTFMHNLQSEIEEDKDKLISDFPSTKKDLEAWLLGLRYQNFRAEELS